MLIDSMDKIMEASFGEASSELSVTFKKTVLVRSYETEVIEASNKVKLDKEVTGIERMFITAIMLAQMEYTTYIELLTKGMVTKSEFDTRRDNILNAINSIKVKADKILGEGIIDKYISISEK